MPQAPAHHAPSAVPESETKDLKAARRAARREDYRSGHRLRTLIVGTLASLLVTFGSIGVGWRLHFPGSARRALVTGSPDKGIVKRIECFRLVTQSALASAASTRLTTRKQLQS